MLYPVVCAADCPQYAVTFRYLRLNRYREIPPVVVGCGICDRCFYNFDDNQLGKASDVISGTPVQYEGMDICVKFDDSMSTRSRDIRLGHFVTDERTTNDAGRRRLALKLVIRR